MFLYLINAISVTLIQFHPENQEIKHRSQVKQSNVFIEEAFPNLTSTSRFFSQCSFHVYQYKENDKIIANLFINKDEYFYDDDSSNLLITPKRVPVLEIYSVVVDSNYRKRGLAARLIFDSVESMIKLYSLPEDTLVGLHLNPLDKMMGISFAFYCTLGFDKASIVEFGPNDFLFKAEKIQNLKHPLHLALRILKNEIIGKFFAMFIKANELRKVRMDKFLLLKTGKTIQNLMLKVVEEEKEYL